MVTSSQTSPGRQTGSGRVRFGLHVPRVWPSNGSDPGSAAIGSDPPDGKHADPRGFKTPKRRRVDAL